jgi:protein-disulfide isomerase
MAFLVLTALVLGNQTEALAGDAAFDKSMDAYLSKKENVEKIAKAVGEYFQKKQKRQQQQAAKNEAKTLEEQFKNPVKIDIAGSATKGNPEARVTVVEFSDFQCPYCSRGKEVMYELLKEYPQDVKVVFKHLPLSFHKEAKPAAIAAEAAGKQGKFWEMHDLLFENQKSLGADKYLELAEGLELDMEQFKRDLANEEIVKRVDADAALAGKLGVRGTPGFFVNGVQVKGARPLPYFKGLVDRWLKNDS